MTRRLEWSLCKMGIQRNIFKKVLLLLVFAETNVYYPDFGLECFCTTQYISVNKLIIRFINIVNFYYLALLNILFK